MASRGSDDGPPTDAPSSGSMTLVLTLDALRELADPNAVLGDAGRWADSVTVAADKPHAVLAYTRDHDVAHEYFSGTSGLGIRGTLTALRQSMGTDRYVLIGSSAEDRELASEFGYEYLTVEAAAEKANWELLSDGPGDDTDDPPDSGPIARLRGWFARFGR